MADKWILEKHVPITGVLNCKTGTRIGGSKEELEIGGMENPILRDPVDKLPYIPGSSIKGKMRTLLEYTYDRVGWKWIEKKLIQDTVHGEPCGCGQKLDDCPVCTLFGPHKNTSHNLGPSRLIFRDAQITKESADKLKALIQEGLLYAEVKTENIINRRSGTAEHPRPMERVPKDTKFDFNVTLRVFKGDDEAKMKKYIKEGLELLQKDYLGGSGTRGYGWIEIQDLKGLDGA